MGCAHHAWGATPERQPKVILRPNHDVAFPRQARRRSQYQSGKKGVTLTAFPAILHSSCTVAILRAQAEAIGRRIGGSHDDLVRQSSNIGALAVHQISQKIMDER